MSKVSGRSCFYVILFHMVHCSSHTSISCDLWLLKHCIYFLWNRLEAWFFFPPLLWVEALERISPTYAKVFARCVGIQGFVTNLWIATDQSAQHMQRWRFFCMWYINIDCFLWNGKIWTKLTPSYILNPIFDFCDYCGGGGGGGDA
jgi:hypothetical protein